jgi:hypothetical protein
VFQGSLNPFKFCFDTQVCASHVRPEERWSRSGNSANREYRAERIRQHRAKNQVSVERAGIIRSLDESRGRAKEREREAEKEEKSREGQMRSTHTHTRAHTLVYIAVQLLCAHRELCTRIVVAACARRR